MLPGPGVGEDVRVACSMFNVNEEILIAPSGDVLSQDSLCWEILMLVLSSPSDHRAPV